MNRFSNKDCARILSVLCEGMGINATCRITGTSKNTVLKLIAEVGEACALYQDRVMTGLNLKKVQCDEIWSFVGMKERNVPEEFKGILGLGDVYTWTAICVDTKLVPCWHVGTRGAKSAYTFIHDLAERLTNRMKLASLVPVVKYSFAPWAPPHDFRPSQENIRQPQRAADSSVFAIRQEDQRA
ncbi:MAG: hypothetical protein WC073_08710 [Sterolibacterium sp.]